MHSILPRWSKRLRTLLADHRCCGPCCQEVQHSLLRDTNRLEEFRQSDGVRYKASREDVHTIHMWPLGCIILIVVFLVACDIIMLIVSKFAFQAKSPTGPAATTFVRRTGCGLLWHGCRYWRARTQTQQSLWSAFETCALTKRWQLTLLGWGCPLIELEVQGALQGVRPPLLLAI